MMVTYPLWNWCFFLFEKVSRNSVDGIATRYGLDGPGIESRWVGGGGGGEIFRTRPDLLWDPE